MWFRGGGVINATLLDITIRLFYIFVWRCHCRYALRHNSWQTLLGLLSWHLPILFSSCDPFKWLNLDPQITCIGLMWRLDSRRVLHITEVYIITLHLYVTTGWPDLNAKMAMNYVGSVTLLDRGDGPAQAVLDRNARSLAQRVAEETKEELARVMSRVDHVSTGVRGAWILSEWSERRVCQKLVSKVGHSVYWGYPAKRVQPAMLTHGT